MKKTLNKRLESITHPHRGDEKTPNREEEIADALNIMSEENFQKEIEIILSKEISWQGHDKTDILDDRFGGIYYKWQNTLTKEETTREKLAAETLVNDLKLLFPNYIFTSETINHFEEICKYINHLGSNYSTALDNRFSPFMRNSVKKTNLRDFLRDKLTWEIVIDIFSPGSSWSFYDCEFLKNKKPPGGNPKKIVFVDKYQINNVGNKITNPKDRDIYIPMDTLAFISLLPNNSVNYCMSGMDRTIITNEEYIDVLKKEVNRTIKKWGLFFGEYNDYKELIWENMSPICIPKDKDGFYVYEKDK